MIETKSEFARRMGWNRSTATRFAQQGRIVLVDGKVDVRASLSRLKETASDAPHHIGRKAYLANARSAGLFQSKEYKERQRKLRSRKKEMQEEIDAGYGRDGRPLIRHLKYREENKERINEKARMRMRERYESRHEEVLETLKRGRENLADWYIAKRLGVALKKCSPEMIEAKRAQMLLARSVKQLEQTIEERKGK